MPTPAPTSVSTLYQLWTLDCVIEAAILISHDYQARYRRYQLVPEDVSELILKFISLLGNHPEWPNYEQRKKIMEPLIGASSSKISNEYKGVFHDAARSVKRAATKYSERVFDTGEPMLRRSFIIACEEFEGVLSTIEGSVVETGLKQTKTIFDAAVTVLSTEKVTSRSWSPTCARLTLAKGRQTRR